METQPRLCAVVLYVADLQRSRDFYDKHLGIRTVLFTDPAEVAAGSENLAGAELVLVQHAQPSPGNSPVLVFGLEAGIDDVVDRLVMAGVPIVTPVREAGGGWVADVADPDANTVSFWQDLQAPRRL